MGDVITRAMSILNRIAYKRRTLQKKSLVAKHGLAVVISLVILGAIIGSTSTFITLTAKDIWTEQVKGGHIVVKAVVSPTPKANASVQSDAQVEEKSSTSAEELARKIYQLESSSDKNDSCHSIGKHNGFGFRQNKMENVCFNFTEEVRELVIDWIIDHKEQGLSDAQLMCHYNTGTPSDTCEYYVKSLTL